MSGMVSGQGNQTSDWLYNKQQHALSIINAISCLFRASK